MASWFLYGASRFNWYPGPRESNQLPKRPDDWAARGSHRSGADPCTTPKKFLGATPTTIIGIRLRTAFMPMIDRSEPKCSLANPYARTTGNSDCPGVSSLSRKNLPAEGEMPRTEKKLSDTS